MASCICRAGWHCQPSRITGAEGEEVSSDWSAKIADILQTRDRSILDRWNAGVPVVDIAREFSLSPNYIYNIIWAAPADAKTAIRKRGRPKGDILPKTREIIKRCRNGESQVDIAREFGVTRQWVSIVARKAGLDRKHQGHVASIATLKAKAERQEVMARNREKREARKAAAEKRLDAAGQLLKQGKTWEEIKTITGIQGSYYVRRRPEDRQKEYAPRRKRA